MGRPGQALASKYRLNTEPTFDVALVFLPTVLVARHDRRCKSLEKTKGIFYISTLAMPKNTEVRENLQKRHRAPSSPSDRLSLGEGGPTNPLRCSHQVRTHLRSTSLRLARRNCARLASNLCTPSHPRRNLTSPLPRACCPAQAPLPRHYAAFQRPSSGPLTLAVHEPPSPRPLNDA